MRFLNKIVFINSAAIRYAEININGNTHFTGTQGVGKSTVLRAILYFYNADTRKLGVPTGPTNKSFADWYLRFADSYIVYEIVRETGNCCIMAFKAQNRVAFRFIDGAYDKKYFIDHNNKAFDNWDAIRSLLDADRRHYSRKINSYDEYRDIIYGNNAGKKEFRKYALMESPQYKNIPRTIQNVFLNSKLEADFIKQTIIWSMNDSDISIDLSTYSHHLSEFETELNDIKRFRYPSVRKYAEYAAKLYIVILNIQSETEEKAQLLASKMRFIKQRKPELQEKKETELIVRKKTEEKKAYERQLFEKRSNRIKEVISQGKGKIKESDDRESEYQKINIHDIIRRVNKRKDLEVQEQDLVKEQNILNSAFSEVTQKFEALIREQENTLNRFINNKNQEKNDIKQSEYNKKEEIRETYDQLKKEITQQNEEKLNTLNETWSQHSLEIRNLDKRKIELKYKEFYLQEKNDTSNKIILAEQELNNNKNNLVHYRQQIEILQRKWEFEKQSVLVNNDREQEILTNQNKQLNDVIDQLKKKIETENVSFIGWLNENVRDWSENIGKVVTDEVLYNQNLSPQTTGGDKNLFGIKINLNEIDKEAKTTEDLRFELNKQIKELAANEKKQNNLISIKEKELQNIQRRNQPKIREFKDLIRKTEYAVEQATLKLKQWKIDLETLSSKGANEKKRLIQQTDKEIALTTEKELSIIDEINQIKEQIKRKIDSKEREAKKKTVETEKESVKLFTLIDADIKKSQEETSNRIARINKQKNNELNQKGADTTRLEQINQQLIIIQQELKYIDSKRETVADYNKDKRELFDRKKEFQNTLQLEEEKLNQLTAAFSTADQKLFNQIQHQSTIIDETEKQIQTIDIDLNKFEEFRKSEIFSFIESHFQAEEKTEIPNRNAVEVMEEITQLYYQRINRRDELKENIDSFLSNFSSKNIFGFSVNPITTEDYFNASENITEFIEENKIEIFEKRTNEKYASIITSLGKETNNLISRTGEIQKIVSRINKDFTDKNFVGAIHKIELRVNDSKNTVMVLLKMIKEFNDNSSLDFGVTNLFSSPDKDKNNQKAIDLLKQLVKEISLAKTDQLHLADAFELTFRVEENQNDTGWVEKLSNVGSDGTDVLVKAMVNIMLLNVFKEGASRRFKDFRLHCMMDEIGKLHPNNVKGILKFANDRNIMLINGSPTESTPQSYRHIYMISKDKENQSKIQRIVSNIEPIL